MNVSIKTFNVDMEVKNSGIEFEIRSPDETHRGDLILTKTVLEWCEGKKRQGNGVKVTWQQFIDWMNSRS
jgi:hypothetical protein